jgi:alpha-D-ribose 1-methylphosphonate 5-triphosphate synthase subunit PhnH
MPFDIVHDLQEVYRKVIQTMSRPGHIENIQESVEKSTFECISYESTLLIAMMLLDGEVSFHVVGDGDSKLSDQLSKLTLARKSELQVADYVFLTSKSNGDTIQNVLREVKKGTLENPQTSATIIMELSSPLSNEGNIILKGPGIQNIEALFIENVKSWLEDRAYVNKEYPLGIDMILVDEIHNIASLPRTTQAEVKEV